MTYTTVPDVVGFQQDHALELLRDLGLIAVPLTSRTTDSTLDDFVLSVSPAPGVVLRTGACVTVTVALLDADGERDYSDWDALTSSAPPAPLAEAPPPPVFYTIGARVPLDDDCRTWTGAHRYGADLLDRSTFEPADRHVYFTLQAREHLLPALVLAAAFTPANATLNLVQQWLLDSNSVDAIALLDIVGRASLDTPQVAAEIRHAIRCIEHVETFDDRHRGAIYGTATVIVSAALSNSLPACDAASSTEDRAPTVVQRLRRWLRRDPVRNAHREPHHA